MSTGRANSIENGPDAPGGLVSPFRLVLRIVAALFVVESLFMLSLPVLFPVLNSAGMPAPWGVATLNATLLAVVTGGSTRPSSAPGAGRSSATS
jgi:hypothetical protein